MIAYHEAGHGVACVALNVAFLHVSIVAEQQWVALRDRTYAHLPATAWNVSRNNQFIRVCGAGPAATMLWSRGSITNTIDAGGARDDADARWYARVTLGPTVTADDIDTYVESQYRHAMNLVEARWFEVTAVAEELLKRHRDSGNGALASAEVRALVRRTRAGCPPPR